MEAEAETMRMRMRQRFEAGYARRASGNAAC